MKRSLKAAGIARTDDDVTIADLPAELLFEISARLGSSTAAFRMGATCKRIGTVIFRALFRSHGGPALNWDVNMECLSANPLHWANAADADYFGPFHPAAAILSKAFYTTEAELRVVHRAFTHLVWYTPNATRPNKFERAYGARYSASHFTLTTRARVEDNPALLPALPDDLHFDMTAIAGGFRNKVFARGQPAQRVELAECVRSLNMYDLSEVVDGRSRAGARVSYNNYVIRILELVDFVSGIELLWQCDNFWTIMKLDPAAGGLTDAELMRIFDHRIGQGVRAMIKARNNEVSVLPLGLNVSRADMAPPSRRAFLETLFPSRALISFEMAGRDLDFLEMLCIASRHAKDTDDYERFIEAAFRGRSFPYGHVRADRLFSRTCQDFLIECDEWCFDDYFEVVVGHLFGALSRVKIDPIDFPALAGLAANVPARLRTNAVYAARLGCLLGAFSQNFTPARDHDNGMRNWDWIINNLNDDVHANDMWNWEWLISGRELDKESPVSAFLDAYHRHH